MRLKNSDESESSAGLLLQSDFSKVSLSFSQLNYTVSKKLYLFEIGLEHSFLYKKSL